MVACSVCSCVCSLALCDVGVVFVTSRWWQRHEAHAGAIHRLRNQSPKLTTSVRVCEKSLNASQVTHIQSTSQSVNSNTHLSEKKQQVKPADANLLLPSVIYFLEIERSAEKELLFRFSTEQRLVFVVIVCDLYQSCVCNGCVCDASIEEVKIIEAHCNTSYLTVLPEILLQCTHSMALLSLSLVTFASHISCLPLPYSIAARRN